MEAMPPLDYDQFATKQDVANLGIELRGDMALMESRLSTEIGGLRNETVTEIGSLRSELGGLRSDFDRQFRQYFFANLAVMLTMVGLVVGLN